MRRTSLLALAVTLAALAGCGKASDPWEGKGGPPRVVTSFAPLACWTKNVAGGRGALVNLCTTVGPHDFTPNDRHAHLLRSANLLVANGLGLDDGTIDRLSNNSGNPKLKVVKLAECLPEDKQIANPDYDPKAPHEHDENGVCQGHGPIDPHAWLGIPQAVTMVKQLAKELADVDPAGSAEYKKNAEEFVAKLKKLQADGKEKVKSLNAVVVPFHPSIRYFAQSFGLRVEGSLQSIPGSDPNNRSLGELVKRLAGEKRVIIAMEPQYQPGVADNLERELKKRGVKVARVMLDPLETCEKDELNTDWYEKKMRENLDNLAGAFAR
jgi:ABC-type Zn uptake system ZnuABC Zn-binding protein ZnuA